MKLTQAQLGLHWRLWKRVKAVLMPGRETWTKHEEDERRHELYTQALGEEKSLTEIDNDDFDKVKAAMLAIVEPGNLKAQLDALNGQRKRLLFGIRKVARELAGGSCQSGSDYVQGIIDRMDARRGEKPGHDQDVWQRERKRDERPQRQLEDLHPRELTKVMVALRKHESRGCVHAHTSSPDVRTLETANVRSGAEPDPF